MSKVLLIDYENVQGINLSELKGISFKVRIFTGSSQNKIPIELVASAQVLGNQVEWIRIDGNGPNALDFHIAYYLGVHATKDPKDEYFILSKDKGFDPLIKHIAKENIRCRRISSISELLSTKKTKNIDGDYEKALSNLKKIGRERRPRSRQRLRQHIKSVLGKSSTEDKLNKVIAQFISSKDILDVDGKLTYKI
jgi:hypothetical protein